MSQQQHPQHQPGWGGPQQQGYGAQPFPPQPPKKSSAGKIIGFGCLGVVALFVLIGVIGAIASTGSTDRDTANATKTSAPAPAAPQKSGPATDSKPAQKAARVKVTAKKAAFSKSVLADGSNYTSVVVTITNDSGKQISVNPLYFTITDTGGTKHTAELGVDDKQLDTVDLAPGENVSGAITGKGGFTPKYVTYTDGLFGDPVRANVS